MSNYVIVTDSSCDLSAEMIAELGITVIPLTLTIADKSYRDLADGSEISAPELYNRLRAGERATTSAVSVGEFEACFEDILSSGRDLLYLGFSSGLSATYSSGAAAAEELKEKYPDRKIFTVDTLAASLGQGMIVWHAVQKQRQGMEVGELAAYVENMRLNAAHWFTVDDLNHLHRGGRVSKTTAVLGSMLNVKPVLHVDNEGHLISVSKARGRKASLAALADKVAQTAVDPASQTMFISHGDCLEDAEYLAKLIKEKTGYAAMNINFVGPVIGSHTGAGVIALFFIAENR